MDNAVLRKRLIDTLLLLPEAKLASGGSEVVVICCRLFCRQNHPNAGPHLYISLLGDQPLMIHCKHCGLQGILTPIVLHDLGIENPELDEYLVHLNRMNRNNKTISNHILKEKSTKYIIPTEIEEKDKFKVDYISERTNIDFTKKTNILNYKVIINLFHFLNINKIKLEENREILKEINKFSVGFMSYNNNILNMRNINSKVLTTRYTNIKIDKNINFPYLYIPPVDIDILTKTPSIVLAEGAFDILCVKNRFFPKDINTTIFGAVGGYGSYKRALMKLIQLTCFFGENISIYSDRDVKIDYYEKIFKNLKQLHNIVIYWSEKTKDFGSMKFDTGNIIKARL